MSTLRAARMLTAEGERRGAYVTIRDGYVDEVADRPPRAAAALDLGELDLIPGLVDLHSDCLEERAHPRPGREQPLLAALLQLDAEAAAHGITTHYLCATLEDDPLQHRSTARAVETARCLAQWRDRLRVQHRVHLRIELTSDAFGIAAELAAEDLVGLISYMHHTPGVGQFADNPEAWRKIYASGFAGTETELTQLIAERQQRGTHAEERRALVADIASQTATPLVSHDDETIADVKQASGLGVRVSEFPLTAEAAGAAADAGIGVVMGAPNAWRGGSHLGGLAARDVLSRGHLAALASDYLPPSLLAAAYALVTDRAASWAEALGLVTAGPAAIAGLTDRGTIAPGQRADLVAIELINGYPVVRQTWVAGRPVLGTPSPWQ